MGEAIRAVLFDLDGTVLNTINMIVDSFRIACKAINMDFDIDMVKSGIGMAMDEFLPNLLGEKISEQDNFLEAYFKYQLEYGNKTITVFDEIVPLLNLLKEMEIPMAVVSSRRRESALHLCQMLDVDKYFDFYVCAGEAKRNKPYGDPLLLALLKLNERNSSDEVKEILSDECAYFGDAIHDIEAAKDAKMLAVLVDWTKVNRTKSEKMADIIYKDLSSINHLLKKSQC